MSIEGTIHEPFLLASYATSQRIPKSVTADNPPENVYATHERASGSSDGYVTVTAQAEGVHVLDLSTLHPVISHTLGPSTTFACPALTRNISEGAESVCTTYAVIDSSSDLKSEDRGRTIWMWRENLSSSLADRATQKKKSVVIPHLITRLFACEGLPSRLLILSPNGDISVSGTDLNIKNTRTSSDSNRSISSAFIYPRTSCSFVPSRSASPRGSIVVLFGTAGDKFNIEILSVDDQDSFVLLGDCEVPVLCDQISTVSCSSSGFVSILSRNGSWRSFQLESGGEAIKLSSAGEPIQLTGLSFISPSHKINEDISLLSLGSSHVLMSGVSLSPAREIALLLWDLQYSVLLASHTLPIPSTLQSKDLTIKLNLVPTSKSQALLVLSPSSSSPGRKAQTTSSRSSVLVVPYAVPPVSTIANAMGRASAGAKWIENDALSGPSGHPLHDATYTQVLDAIKTAMSKNLPQAANTLFFEWERREKIGKISGSNDVSDVNGGTSQKGKARIDALPVMGHSFVKDVLATVFQLSKPANTPYSSEIVHYLLKRRIVSSGMVEGGLLGALRLKNDWKSVELAFDHVLDLSEAEIMETLQIVVARHRQGSAVPSDDANAMQVDSPSTDVPPLPAFLPECICYSTSPAALRLAIRRHLSDADDLASIIQVLEEWMIKWGARHVKMLPNKKEVSNNEHGVPVLKIKDKSEDKELPPLNTIVVYLQTLLDASFLTLLQHPPSQRLLRSLSARLEPEITFIDQIEQLRGPLEPFAKAQIKAVREAGEDKKKEPVTDWRQRKKLAHEQAGVSVGLYRLEELVL